MTRISVAAERKVRLFMDKGKTLEKIRKSYRGKRKESIGKK